MTLALDTRPLAQGGESRRSGSDTAQPLRGLVAAEGRILRAQSRVELRHLTLEAVARLVPCGLAGWIDARGRLLATSTNGRADRNTPFCQWLERELDTHVKAGEAATVQLSGTETHVPWRTARLAPLAGGGALVVLGDAQVGGAAETATLERLALLAGQLDRRVRAKRGTRRRWPWVALALGATLCIPVRLSTLAPVEIVSRNPHHVTAPFEGTVEAVRAEPFAIVRKGELVARLDPTRPSNALEIAAREEALAEARARRAELAAFSDPVAKAEVAVARAEAALAAARKDHARHELQQTDLRAPASGVAVILDPEDWSGRPVAAGETLFTIADPDSLEARIHVPPDSGEALERGARVRVFLDADPSHALEAALTRAALQADEGPDGALAFEARADVADSSPALRLGARGVAKIYGEPAPLGWWLLRKPVRVARQTLGL